MKSMTGFGRSSHRAPSGKTTRSGSAGPAVDLDVSIRAVNGRYFEVRFHIPREYAGLESELKSALSKIFVRGTLDLYIGRNASSAAEVSVNTGLAKEWLSAYRKLGKELKLNADPSLDMIARVPEVLQVASREEVSDAEKKLVRKLVSEAAEACDLERKREGDALRKTLSKLCSQLDSMSKQMEALKNEANSELEKRYRDRLRDGLSRLGEGLAVDNQRIAQEIVIQIDRADISEELMRLKEHLKAYQALLTNAEPQGKKLDFYAQELLREVNTVGSKSHIAKLTSLVVEAKTVVERIREQVQNAE